MEGIGHSCSWPRGAGPQDLPPGRCEVGAHQGSEVRARLVAPLAVRGTFLS